MEEVDLPISHNGELLIDLIREHKKATYKELLKDKKDTEKLSREIMEFEGRMSDAIQSGLNSSEAKEIHWLPLC